MKQKKVTFADIAAYTGFSKTTISRYFNNPDSLTLENQEKITHALDVLGYQENKLAKVLAFSRCGSNPQPAISICSMDGRTLQYSLERASGATFAFLEEHCKTFLSGDAVQQLANI